MVEIVSWIGVAVIALGALVGFSGVVATSILTVVRHLRAEPAARASVPAPAPRAVTPVG